MRSRRLFSRAPLIVSERPVSWRRRRGVAISSSPVRYLPGQRCRIAHHLRGRALRDEVAAVYARAGPHVDDVVGRQDGVAIVLDDQHGVAEIAQPLQRLRAGAGCRAGASRSTARRECRARRPGSSRSASPAGCAAPRRPRGWPTARSKRQVVEPDVAMNPRRSTISFRMRRAISSSWRVSGKRGEERRAPP